MMYLLVVFNIILRTWQAHCSGYPWQLLCSKTDLKCLPTHLPLLVFSEEIAWKRPVYGIREMCDVCNTTLFNVHWVCPKCGYVVCLDCYRTITHKRTCCGSIDVKCQSCERGQLKWLKCSSDKKPHTPNDMKLTQIIPSDGSYSIFHSSRPGLTNQVVKWILTSRVVALRIFASRALVSRVLGLALEFLQNSRLHTGARVILIYLT